MMKAILFGAGKRLVRFYQRLAKDYDVVAVCDNNPEKEWNGESVIPPERIKEHDYDVIILTPKECDEIYKQLINMGIDSSKIVLLNDVLDSLPAVAFGFDFYGQYCEDLIIAAIFNQIGIPKPTYIDIGINHPNIGNNTAFLYKNGCRGINIDVNPNVMEDVRKYRKEDINLNIGLAKQKGVLKYYMFDEKSGINTFSEKEMKSHDIPIQKCVDLPVTTLTEVINKHCKHSFPDFMDIDIEGLDYEVLEEYDLFSNGPAVILVEVRKGDMNKFHELLLSKDYFFFCRIGENNFYVRNKYLNRLCHL